MDLIGQQTVDLVLYFFSTQTPKHKNKKKKWNVTSVLAYFSVHS